MKIMMIAIALGAMTIGTAASAAGPVNARQVNQERRIDAGRRSGKLTMAEGARLKREQMSIRNEETMMRRHHGHLTARDKRIIHARQRAANRHILREKHNGHRGKNHLKL